MFTNVGRLRFKDVNSAKAYAAELNGDKAKAVAHCQKLLVRQHDESMLKFLDELGGVKFKVVNAELKLAVNCYIVIYYFLFLRF